MILYHGSKQKFDKFLLNPPKRNTGCITNQLGIFLVDNKYIADADFYSKDGYIYTCEVDIKNYKEYTTSKQNIDGFDVLFKIIDSKFKLKRLRINSLKSNILYYKFITYYKKLYNIQKLWNKNYDGLIIHTARDTRNKIINISYESQNLLSRANDFIENIFQKYNIIQLDFSSYLKLNFLEKQILNNYLYEIDEKCSKYVDDYIKNTEKIKQYIIFNPNSIKILNVESKIKE